MPSPTTKRLHFLDTLRTIAILVVFLFHCARFFDADDWHVKNAITTTGATLFIISLVLWIMPLFFFISGGSSWFAIQKKSAAKFFTDRVKRIFIPLAFGCLVLALPQVYFERVSHGAYQSSLINFIPHYFEGMYGFGGNFAWMGLHLWYLLLLFVFSCLLLPIFVVGKTKLKGSTIEKVIQGPLAFILFPVLTFIPGFLLNPDHFIGFRVWGGWNLVEHLLFLLLGFLAFSGNDFIQNCKRYKIMFTVIGLAATSLIIYWYLAEQPAAFGTSFFALKVAIRSVACWMMISAILGWSAQYLNLTGKRWSYSSEAVLPFYILHQTVIIILGYYIVQWNIPIVAKYSLIAFFSFITIAALYDWVVRRTKVTRWLFGMMPVRKVAASSLNTTSETRISSAIPIKT